MKFINFVKYKDLDSIAGDRAAQFAYADRLRTQGELAIGGPLLDDQGRRTGLLFIYAIASAKTDQLPRNVTMACVALTGLLFGYSALLALSHTVIALDGQIVEVVAQKVVTATTGGLLLAVSLSTEKEMCPSFARVSVGRR